MHISVRLSVPVLVVLNYFFARPYAYLFSFFLYPFKCQVESQRTSKYNCGS